LLPEESAGDEDGLESFDLGDLLDDQKLFIDFDVPDASEAFDIEADSLLDDSLYEESFQCYDVY
jgi:hypothetical protein